MIKRPPSQNSFKLSHKISPFGSNIVTSIIGETGVSANPVLTSMSAYSVGPTTLSQSVLISPIKDPHTTLPTPIKVNKLISILEGYDVIKLKFRREGFTFGVRLGFVGLPDTILSKNHKSTDLLPEVINEFISKGQLEGRIAGPFASPPFEPFVSSPLGVVPKSEPGKYRVIHDLSFPRHNSVNLRIPTENSQVQYDSIDTITQLVIQFGQGALMAKTDIKDAFWIIPSHPDNHRLLCFSWDCFYYYDKCLPMGASSSCKIF